MRIAINYTFFRGQHTEARRFIQACVARLSKEHPEDSFLFITDKSTALSAIGATGSVHLIPPAIKTPLHRKLWYNYKLPAALKKQQAGIVVQADARCSLRTEVPQILLLPEIPAKLPWFQKKTFQRSLTIAQRIIVPSETLQQQLSKAYSLDAKKIIIIRPGIETYPLSEIEKESIKQQYADGKDFFLYAGPALTAKDAITLLKAFSFFKRRQKSSMLLLLSTTTGTPPANMDTYKYRQDVYLLANHSEKTTAQLMAAAYAFLYPCTQENNGWPVVQAMRNSSPVIATSNNMLTEIGGDAVLYTAPGASEDMAEKMMLLYKDEKQRQAFIDKGIHQSNEYNWISASQQLWKAIQSIARS